MQTLNQIDLVPTISLALGLPIPFGSLGSVVLDLFLGQDMRTLSSPSSTSQAQTPSDSFYSSLLLTASQIHRYLREYSNHTRQFSAQELALLEDKYSHFISTPRTREYLLEFIEKYQHYHSSALSLCKDLWTTFDTTSMSLGVALLLFGIIGMLLLLGLDSSPLSSPRRNRRIVSLVISFGGVISILLGLRPLYLFIISAASVFLFLTTFPPPSLVFQSKYKEVASLDSLAALVIFALRLAGLNSNSFIEAEEKVSSFLLISLLLIRFYDALRTRRLQQLPAIVFVLLSLKLLSFATSSKQDSIDLSWELVFPLLTSLFSLSFSQDPYIFLLSGMLLFVSALAGTVGIPSAWIFCGATLPLVSLRDYINRFESLPPLPNNLLSCQLAAIAIYWITTSLGLAGDLHSSDSISLVFRIFFPQFVYLSTLFSLGYLCQSRTIPFSKRIQALMLVVVPFFLLITGKRALTSFLLLLVSLYFFAKTFPSPFFAATFASLLSTLFFYKSGHSPAFSALPFHTAYIGFDNYYFIAGAVILVMNTFSAYLLIPMVPFFSAVRPTRLAMLLQHTLVATMTIVFTGIQRRHLMVWRIFAPKVMFDSVALFVVDGCLLMMALVEACRQREIDSTLHY